MRRAAGVVTGKTVAAQIRQAMRNLDYAADTWRIREAWYGRAGGWSAATIDDLRRRFAAWQEEEGARSSAERHLHGDTGRHALEMHLSSVRKHLAEVERRLVLIEGEIARSLALGSDG